MPLDELHATIAAIALGAAGRHGFALGGGHPVVLVGEQVDVLGGPVDDPVRDQGVAAAGAVEAALRAAGFDAERQDKTAGLADVFYGMGDGLAEWIVTGPGGRQMMLQMAYFDRDRRPVTMDIGPVLDLEDVVGSKVCALASRVEPRDYVDTAAALERYTVDQLIAYARRLDPGLTDQDFADAGRQLDKMPDGLFARYGLDAAAVGRLRERFAAWPRT